MNTTSILQKLDELKTISLIGSKNALNLKDAALFTGLSKVYLRYLISERRIPCYKSSGGKLVYFKKEDLEKWMLNHKKED